MFTVRQLQFFEALAREKHFRRAAAAVSVTQPALSSQIMEMEARVGTSLFERNRNGVTLTAMGKKLLPQALAVLQQLQELEDMCTQGPLPLNGTVEIGMIPTIAPYLLPRLLPAIQQQYPQLELKVREAKTEHLVTDLQSGKLQAIVAADPIGQADLKSIRLFDDPFFIASGTNSDDVIASPAAHDAVSIERLMLLEDGHCLRDQALAVCNGTGGKQVLNFGATSMTTILQLVANGMGMTLIPALAVDAETRRLSGITITKFADPPPARSIALFYRRASARTLDVEALAAEISKAAEPLLAYASRLGASA